VTPPPPPPLAGRQNAARHCRAASQNRRVSASGRASFDRGEEMAIGSDVQRWPRLYDADTRAAIKRFTALFEPLVILIMGVMGAQ